MVQSLCALRITAGLFLLLGIRPADVVGGLRKPFLMRKERQRRIRRITGKPKGRLAATLDSARDMLAAAGMGERASIYGWVALVLAVGLGASPLIVIRIRTADYLRSLHEKLESAMGTVTNSYVASGDVIGAVESSMHLFPAPEDGVFRQFYTQTQFINSDMAKDMRQMREHIDNRYWRDLCDVLLQCQRDRQLRFALPGIVSRLGLERR